MKKFLALFLSLVTVVCCVGMFASCAGDKAYTISTGGPQGTYYGFTGVVAGKLTENIPGATFTAVTSGGSKVNIEAIDDGDAQMAIVQNDVMINAYNGKENFSSGAIRSFSVIGAVYPEVCQIIASRESGIRTVADMRGKRVSIGAAGSGVVTNATQILRIAGLTLQDVDVQNLDSGASAAAMKEGKLDAFFFTGGVPTPAVVDLMTAKTITVVSLTDEQVAALKAESSFYVEVPMTHATYKDIPEGETVKAVAVTATYIVANSVSEDIVYQITKTLWEKQGEIAAAHATGKNMNIQSALLGMDNVPVHAGAKKYYEEYLAGYNTDKGTSLTFDQFYYNK